jgi:formylglycine-generating enzyme required for sulfatase activity/uncharacterized caspase-like protein
MSQNWAICIGIDRYDNLQPLQYARRDAEALRDFLARDAVFEKVYFFGEDAPPIQTDFGEPIRSVPTAATLRRFLRVRFEQKFLRPSDNLWFFFAGHGRRERDRDYLMPLDADPGDVEHTAIPVGYITERLRRCGAENVVLIVDACRNEGARDGQGIGAERQPGVVTISSCSPNERSYEIGELQHGAFTYTLLEGLRLQGEGNCATVERLDQYLRVRVPELCRRYGKPRQTPYTNAEPIEKRHLILLPKLASLTDLDPIKLDALAAETNGNLELAEQLWWRVIAVSPVDAQAHDAIKRLALKQSAPEAVRQPDGPRAGGNDADARGPGWLTRRRAVALAGLATAGAIGAVLAPGMRRLVSRPSLRTVGFESIQVDGRGARTAVERGTAAVFTEPLGPGDGLDMVLVPAGSFTMGSPSDEPYRRFNEGPQHHVTLPAFFMSAFPITQAQWSAVVMAHPGRVERDLSPSPSTFREIDLPVETISWNQAVEFCLRLTALTGRPYRLPSEAEWEYACRAGSVDAFHCGPTITPGLANYCGTGGAVCGEGFASETYDDMKYGPGSYGIGPEGRFLGKTTRPGTYPPNRFGLYDMHGNVWEFCEDTLTGGYADAPRDGRADQSGASGIRVLRGGSWSHHPAICRSAYRDGIPADAPGWPGRMGMRVVCTL